MTWESQCTHLHADSPENQCKLWLLKCHPEFPIKIVPAILASYALYILSKQIFERLSWNDSIWLLYIQKSHSKGGEFFLVKVGYHNTCLWFTTLLFHGYKKYVFYFIRTNPFTKSCYGNKLEITWDVKSTPFQSFSSLFKSIF